MDLLRICSGCRVSTSLISPLLKFNVIENIIFFQVNIRIILFTLLNSYLIITSLALHNDHKWPTGIRIRLVDERIAAYEGRTFAPPCIWRGELNHRCGSGIRGVKCPWGRLSGYCCKRLMALQRVVTSVRYCYEMPVCSLYPEGENRRECIWTQRTSA